jgi:hypothetical protein
MPAIQHGTNSAAYSSAQSSKASACGILRHPARHKHAQNARCESTHPSWCITLLPPTLLPCNVQHSCQVRQHMHTFERTGGKDNNTALLLLLLLMMMMMMMHNNRSSRTEAEHTKILMLVTYIQMLTVAHQQHVKHNPANKVVSRIPLQVNDTQALCLNIQL